MAYNNGTHVCEVEVDIETGRVAITRYVVVHDCGRMINPMMVEGQVHRRHRARHRRHAL